MPQKKQEEGQKEKKVFGFRYAVVLTVVAVFLLPTSVLAQEKELLRPYEQVREKASYKNNLIIGC